MVPVEERSAVPTMQRIKRFPGPCFVFGEQHRSSKIISGKDDAVAVVPKSSSSGEAQKIKKKE